MYLCILCISIFALTHALYSRGHMRQPRKSDGRHERGASRGDILSELCDIIILRFPGVKSNAQTQHFAGGVRSLSVGSGFFFLFNISP